MQVFDDRFKSDPRFKRSIFYEGFIQAQKRPLKSGYD